MVPLPAAVYMMQADVINHYQYALENYLTLTLNEVENSSLRTPYQKWARVTNEDFTILADSHGPAARPTFAASGLGAETDRRRS